MRQFHPLTATAIVAACLILAVLPLLGLTLEETQRHHLIHAHEFAAPLCALLAIAWSQRRSRARQGANIYLWIFGAFAIGCLVYNNGLGLERYPRNYLGDAAFVCASVLLCYALQPTKNTAPPLRQWGLVAAMWAILAGFQYQFVVRPFLTVAAAYPLPVHLVFYSYTATSCLWGALALLASLSAASFFDLLFAAGTVVIFVADFASRYEALQTVTVSTCWAESAWAAGLGLMSASTLLTVYFGAALPLTADLPYRWLSVKAISRSSPGS